MPKAILGWDGIEYHASHSQIGNRFFPQQINCLPFKLGGLPPRKVRKSQSCGVVASGRKLCCRLTPIPKVRNPPDHASTLQLCMLPGLQAFCQSTCTLLDRLLQPL